MRLARLVVRSIVVAIVMFALGFIGHQLLRGHDYVSIEPIMRNTPDMQADVPFALLSSLCFAAAFVWIYSQGRSSHKPWFGQGLRFGVAVWALVSAPLYLTNYMIEPRPGLLVAKVFGWEIIAAMLLGLLVAALSKNDGAAQERKT